jgi:HK97 family phage prohead protease
VIRMGFYAPIAKVDAEERMVWGYASTAAEDDQGETITRDALAEALAEYLKFANIREMHQMSAVGIAEEAAVDGKGLYVAARIVDPRAWDKVRSGVYKGFSIGGKVRSRDPADRKTITALTLSEISLVDRPANPEAVFDCWKADGAGPMAGRPGDDQAALDHVHDCLKALTDGDCCAAVKAMGHHAKRMLDHLKAAHDAVCRAGAQCDGFVVDGHAEKATRADDLVKAFTGEIMPRLDALAKRIEEIAAVPLPPLTMARAAIAVSKRQDAGNHEFSPDDIVAALAGMSEEERTLTLIKAAHANPISPFSRPAPLSER